MSTALEFAALKAIEEVSVLLLQKTSCTSKDKDHILSLEEMMVAEGRTIESHLRGHLSKCIVHVQG